MCRWLAYSGSPILLKEALYTPAHSLVDQSLHSQLGAETTNGDGFGVGWYGDGPIPGVFHSIEPAWNDHNLHELAAHVSSSRFFTHIRAAIGSAVQQTNCHPFRYGRWLFMHNGYINEFGTLKRDLVLTVDPSLYPKIEGHTDTEVLFFLALTFGLEDDPPAAIERAVGLVEAVGSRLGVAASLSGHDRNDRRRDHVGRPVLERGQVALAVLHDGRAHAAQALSRTAVAQGGLRGGAADRVRAAGRRRRRLERGARGELWHRRPRPRRDATVPPAGAVEVDPRGCLTGRAGDHRGAAVHFTVSVPCIPAARWASTEQ